MVAQGLVYTVLSGICNGLFTGPMKMIRDWKWENTWFVFIVTACLAMPIAVVSATLPDWRAVIAHAPGDAVVVALLFGFLWGFGAILFGLGVDALGVSLANTLVIGVSSALGSLVPLALGGALRWAPREIVLYAGVLTFLVGVCICGTAGRMREAGPAGGGPRRGVLRAYVFCGLSGVLSAVFNIGYALAKPIADAGEALGQPRFLATNCIWLLMLGAGALPNLAFCGYLMRKNGTAGLLAHSPRSGALSVVMGLLWGGSIFLYGAATPLLGATGPSIGWPVSLAVGLVVANAVGFLMGEWKTAGGGATRRMQAGIAVLLLAIAVCAVSSTMRG